MSKSFRTIASLLFFHALCVHANAATVSGRVLDAGTLDPIADATVVFSLWTFFPEVLAQAQSDADGRFEFSFDGTSLYGIGVSHPGYLGNTRLINLTAGVDVENVDVLLSRAASINVRLLDAESGLPVTGSLVFSYRQGGGGTGVPSNDLGEVLFHTLQAVDIPLMGDHRSGRMGVQRSGPWEASAADRLGVVI